MSESFNQEMKKHFQQQQLSQSQLSHLMNMQQEHHANAQSKSKPVSSSSEWLNNAWQSLMSWPSIAIASCLLIVALNLPLTSSVSPVQPLENISQQAVYMHLQKMPLEIQSKNNDELGNYFSQLDFNLKPSSFMSSQYEYLVGGRYATVDGKVAAQLRYQKGQQQFTVYQTVYHPQQHGKVPNYLSGEKPLISQVKGFSVEIWRENDVLMVCVVKDAHV